VATNSIPPPAAPSRTAGAGAIRIVGDPVLAKRAEEVDDIDAALVALTGEMLTTMYDAPGLGLAAPQVGVSRRFFVYDVGEGPAVLVNPEITDTDGEWAYAEGCLSIPELTFEVVRPKQVHVTGRDLDGNEVSIEADELLARLFQHELDHLDGVLFLEHLDDDQSKEAKRFVRDLRMRAARPVPSEAGGLHLP
jgi:peptide deformylase